MMNFTVNFPLVMESRMGLASAEKSSPGSIRIASFVSLELAR
jgi:hypothetical protein